METKTQTLPEVDLDTVPMVEDPEEDLDSLAEYSFPKFAATYFQKSASHSHIRKPLQYPLLYHEDNADCSVPSISLVSSGSSYPQSPWPALWAPCFKLSSSWDLCLNFPRVPWLCGPSS